MTHPTPARLLALSILVGVMPCCSWGLTSLSDTVALWRHGDRSSAVARCTAEYERFRDTNDLAEDAVRGWADALTRRVDEEPVIGRSERPQALPDALKSDELSGLDQEIRSDLLSHQASRVARAIGVVRGLTLTQHATILIALVYGKRVVDVDGDVLSTLDPAERTVTIKRMALDALERLE